MTQTGLRNCWRRGWRRRVEAASGQAPHSEESGGIVGGKGFRGLNGLDGFREAGNASPGSVEGWGFLEIMEAGDDRPCDLDGSVAGVLGEDLQFDGGISGHADGDAFEQADPGVIDAEGSPDETGVECAKLADGVGSAGCNDSDPEEVSRFQGAEFGSGQGDHDEIGVLFGWGDVVLRGSIELLEVCTREVGEAGNQMENTLSKPLGMAGTFEGSVGGIREFVADHGGDGWAEPKEGEVFHAVEGIDSFAGGIRNSIAEAGEGGDAGLIRQFDEDAGIGFGAEDEAVEADVEMGWVEGDAELAEVGGTAGDGRDGCGGVEGIGLSGDVAIGVVGRARLRGNGDPCGMERRGGRRGLVETE